jgi:hypothetical protein
MLLHPRPRRRRPFCPAPTSTWGAALLLTVTTVAACDGSGTLSIDDLPARVSQAVCAFEVACGSAPDQATCEAANPIAADQVLATTIAAVKRGTIAYDGTSAAKCLDAYPGTNCSLTSLTTASDLADCDATFRGQVAVGGACVIAAECTGHGPCTQPANCTQACCVGTCGSPQVAMGGDCSTSNAGCIDGTFCKAGVCSAYIPVGAACVAGDTCASGAACSSAGTCLPLPAEGQSCATAQGGLCDHLDDYCDPVTITCIKRKPAGAACAAPSSEDCVTYAPCQNGVCTPFPTLGQVCDQTAGATCLDELVCTADVCTAPAKAVACQP